MVCDAMRQTLGVLRKRRRKYTRKWKTTLAATPPSGGRKCWPFFLHPRRIEGAGGPANPFSQLLDHSGNVVGVVTARIDAAKMLKERGKIPQNVNFALKASLVRDMLEVQDIDYETASSKRELKTVDIFDKAKKFTVLVECLQ